MLALQVSQVFELDHDTRAFGLAGHLGALAVRGGHAQLGLLRHPRLERDEKRSLARDLGRQRRPVTDLRGVLLLPPVDLAEPYPVRTLHHRRVETLQTRPHLEPMGRTLQAVCRHRRAGRAEQAPE